MQNRGGITSFVETVARTPLWNLWNVQFISTHRRGSVAARTLVFARAVAAFTGTLLVRRPDVVHLHMAKDGSYFRKAALLWLARLRRVPIVLHVHAGEFRLFYDRMPRSVRWSIRWTLSRASVVVALGGRWAQRLREIAPDARIVAIPNPVQIVGAGRQPDAADPVHVVFLGTMGDPKGTFVLLEAWSKVVANSSGVPARLTLAGNGEVERARDTVSRLGLADTVDVRSWLSPDEVADLLGTAQVLTLPSRNEGQPMSILEAMGRGLCVVATDVGGIPDLVEDGASGVLVAPDDVDALAAALNSVIDDADLRTRLGQAALDRARSTFDVDVIWRRFDALYRELVPAAPQSDGDLRTRS
ncbi:glycosyltransferase family 4 protein [Pseudonocardia bannensis]|uniref:Glycosyltransferase family 4 protein n=1 Tax=Pseudonocardia bannensis TaxID=630973 RepID=A0A848DEU9_9PSEU|nr:glycosyltransferase family 4 protein [Pseudonocardia bannensis]